MNKRFMSGLLFFLIAGVLFAQSNLQVIAEVNLTKREPITLGQLKNFVKEMEKTSGGTTTPAQRKEILDGLINQKLILQIAQKEGIKISDSEVNNYFNNMLSQMIGRQITEFEFAKVVKEQTGKNFDQFMKSQNGLTVSEYKDFIRDNLTSQSFVFRKSRKEIESAVPTDTQINNVYDVNKQNFVRPDSATLFIVAVEKKGKTDIEKTKIDGLHTRLSKNTKLIDTIMKESQKENSGFAAVDVYAYKTEDAARQMGVSMEKLLEVFASPVNTVSNVVEMPNNFQFFVIKEKTPMKFLSLKEKIDPRQDMTVYEYIKGQLTMQLQQVAVQKATADLVKDLKVDKNYKILKSDTELTKILSW